MEITVRIPDLERQLRDLQIAIEALTAVQRHAAPVVQEDAYQVPAQEALLAHGVSHDRRRHSFTARTGLPGKGQSRTRSYQPGGEDAARDFVTRWLEARSRQA